MSNKDGTFQGQDYQAPSEKWVSLKLSPNNEHANTKAYYTKKLKFA